MHKLRSWKWFICISSGSCRFYCFLRRTTIWYAAAWDLDALDYQGQLSDLQATLDSTIADYQDQLSTLVDNHASQVSELNGEIDALQGQYDAAVVSWSYYSWYARKLGWWGCSMQAAWDLK